MKRLRFHIAGLLCFVLFVGFALAALREADDLWDSAVFSTLVVALLVSVLLAIHRTQAHRAFWLGFAVFGCTCLGACLIPSIESRLLTTKLLAFVDSRLPARPVIITGQAWGDMSNTQGGTMIQAPVQGYVVAAANPGNQRIAYFGNLLGTGGGSSENFKRIGHAVLTLLAAWTGGLLSRRLYSRNRHGPPLPDSPSLPHPDNEHLL
jgi:hypothetical protein